MIGYHHVLMIFIAIAIILLCESLRVPGRLPWNVTNLSSPIIGRMLVIVPANPQHISDLHVLPELQAGVQFGAGRPEPGDRDG